MIKVLSAHTREDIEHKAKSAASSLWSSMQNNAIPEDDVIDAVDNFILELPWDHQGCFIALVYLLRNNNKLFKTFKRKYSYDLEKHVRELADETAKSFGYADDY